MSEIILLSIIGAAVLLCLFRLLRGPTAPDRAVAADSISAITTALLVYLAHLFGRDIYLDVSLVYAVLAFIGSVAIARYLERGL
jgi:multicomponent Na+:H+ antiporter subunit F